MALGFKTLYDRAERAAGSRTALWLLGGVSFAESAVLPVPVDAVSVPIMLSSRRRIPVVVLIATVTSVLGGLLGYALGWGFYEALAKPLLGWLGVSGQLEAFAARMQDNPAGGSWLIFMGALTPIPFKVVCIGSGVVQFDLTLFIAVAMAGRLLRFLFFGVLFWVFGEPLKAVIRRNSGWSVLALLVVVVGGFVAVSLLF
ncbi:MAG: cytochrome B [Kiloniella sp.]|nr:cytochrome B [Kiloniella sp.]